MALLVGIDEAGYGPRLGPLVIAAAAIRFPPHSVPASTQLWSQLSSAVQNTPQRGDDRLVIADSKRLWRSGRGLARIERSCLSFVVAGGGKVSDFRNLIDRVSINGDGADGGAPWDRPEAVALPLAADAEGIRQGAERLRSATAHYGASCAGLHINVVPPARFNRLIEETDNKADALFALTAEVLKHLMQQGGDEPILATMDKQGGRAYYGRLLARTFPGMTIHVQSETPAESRYRLSGLGCDVQLAVVQNAESRSLLAALASMTAKYVRELFMRQLNAFFSRRVPTLKPTAGYWVDAERFLRDTASARASAGISDEVLIRVR
ncbi:MAG: hypothetical protein QGD94_05320 [Planctomycetia bacterium]|nr:hypothetical protein [Planctomycetia bacterium]